MGLKKVLAMHGIQVREIVDASRVSKAAVDYIDHGRAVKLVTAQKIVTAFNRLTGQTATYQDLGITIIGEGNADGDDKEE